MTQYKENSFYDEIKETVSEIDDSKQDKESGKGLSSNDFTNTLKTKLDNIKVNKLEAFSVTTNGSGDFSVSLSQSFTNPKATATVVATKGSEGYHCHLEPTSGAVSTISGRAFRNKTQGVLLGGTIDPDNPVAADVRVDVIVAEVS